MIRKLFTSCAVLSLLLCAATVVLWICTARLPRGLEVHGGRNGQFSLYSRNGMLGWKNVGMHGVYGWDFDFSTVVLFTQAIPLAWVWERWGRRKQVATTNPPTEANSLRDRIHFLLPNTMAVWVIVGLAITAAESRHAAALLWVVPIEAALIANIVARQHAKTRLKRLLAGSCVTCGYSLTGNISGICPECGTAINATRTANPCGL